MTDTQRNRGIDPVEMAAAAAIANDMSRQARNKQGLPPASSSSDVPTAIAVAVVVLGLLALMIYLK